jgi:hypothetical protein
VIGGVLASSFVQQSLKPQLVGFLGVLVLLASLVKQQYHPEVAAAEASLKASKLQVLIRDSEDRIAMISATVDTETDDPESILALVKDISGGLSALELQSSNKLTVVEASDKAIAKGNKG